MASMRSAHRALRLRLASKLLAAFAILVATTSNSPDVLFAQPQCTFLNHNPAPGSTVTLPDSPTFTLSVRLDCTGAPMSDWRISFDGVPQRTHFFYPGGWADLSVTFGRVPEPLFPPANLSPGPHTVEVSALAGGAVVGQTWTFTIVQPAPGPATPTPRVQPAADAFDPSVSAPRPPATGNGGELDASGARTALLALPAAALVGVFGTTLLARARRPRS